MRDDTELVATDPSTQQALEAILFVVDDPVDRSTLCQVLEISKDQLDLLIDELSASYERERRGFVLREVAGGLRMYTAPAVAEYVERWVLSGRSGRLSQAALETLAVVAYKQPIARQEISDVRGVNADAALRTLLARGLVDEVGRDPGPGQAILYGTTDLLLEKLGLRSLDDLPPISDYLRDDDAPDEPRPGDLRAARDRLRSGAPLPSTGRGRWDPDAPEEGGVVEPDPGDQPDAVDGPDPDEPDLDGEPADGVEARRRREDEMDDLSDALDQAARNAMAALDEAMRAVDDAADEPAADEADEDVDEDGGSEDGDREDPADPDER